MVKKPYALGGLAVVMFLTTLLYAYTIPVEPAGAQLSEIIQQGLRSSGGRVENFGVPGSRVENPIGGTKLKNPINFQSLGALIAAILDIIVQIAVPIAALFLIYSGFLFVSARGDEAQLKAAKSIFLWTMVGIAVILGAKILASVIENTINQFKG